MHIIFVRQALTLNSCLFFPDVFADSTLTHTAEDEGATESKDGVVGKIKCNFATCI